MLCLLVSLISVMTLSLGVFGSPPSVINIRNSDTGGGGSDVPGSGGIPGTGSSSIASKSSASSSKPHSATDGSVFMFSDSWTNIVESSIQVECNSHQITVKIPSPISEFSGMVYPQGLSKNSSCLKEYQGVDTIVYELPLRSCNTMTTSEGFEEEFWNTIILEPHPKLVTGNGKGFHIRCKYKKNGDGKNLPLVSMKILREGQEIAGEHVRIGDPLVLNITIESQHKLPFRITDCNVKDGLGWGEESLVNSVGCSMDGEIMGQFEYNTLNSAIVKFFAHKFPYSPSVYYACAVKICKDCHPPECNGKINTRRRRETGDGFGLDEEPATIEVYNGLYVNEMTESERERERADKIAERKHKGNVLCFNKRDFALAIAISGLLLMIAVIIVIFILCIRRRQSIKGSESGGSSIYSGGYTNTAYSHSS